MLQGVDASAGILCMAVVTSWIELGEASVGDCEKVCAFMCKLATRGCKS